MITMRVMGEADLPTVSSLGIRSKASWGYSPEAMDVFSGELKIRAGELSSLSEAKVAEVGAEIVGYFTLRDHGKGEIELEHLFVDPPWFGKGMGTALLKEALRSARIAKIGEVTVIADPNSSGFYQKRGAEVIGEHESSIGGRKIPVLSIATSGDECTRGGGGGKRSGALET